jgi:hypothetical protein
MTTLPPAPPSALLDALLRLAPLDVLLFDTELVCRYAAPADGTLFGRTAAQLVGEPDAALFPAGADDLLAALRLAAEQAAAAQYRSYRYTHREATTETLFCWSVRIAPVLLHDYRGREEFHGVLVTLADIQDLADTNDRLQRELTQLRGELAASRAREAAALADRRRLQEAVRTVLTPVLGYLQVLSRRPHILNTHPVGSLIEERVLPGLHQVVDLVDTPDTAESPADDASQRHP